ncbi:hypothetical protein Ae201684P_012977 [Aphanomyces euteiches]|nr:hypothetical protein Ae201684P_012977 [Aphanomyces euteiches]
MALFVKMLRGAAASKVSVIRQRSNALRVYSSASYDWMRDLSSPKLHKFLQNEHDLWRRESKPYRKFQRQIYSEMRSRLNLGKVEHSVPEQIGEYMYYLKTVPRMNFPIYCRQHILHSGKEEVVLNPNDMEHFGQIGVFKVSPDGNFIAYTVDMSGDELYNAFIKEIRSSRVSKINNYVRSIDWDQVGSLYYTVPDDFHRPNRVYRHRHGKDTLVFEEADPSVYLDVVLTKDMRFVLINANSKRSSEVHSLDANDTAAIPVLVRARDPDVLYFADHSRDAFYIASNYKVVVMPDKNRGEWFEGLTDHPDVKIDEIDLFQDFLVLYERAAGVPQIRIAPLADLKSTHLVPLADYSNGILYPCANRNFASNTVRFSVATPLLPETVLQYEIPTRTLTVLKEAPAVPQFDPSGYICHRVLVPHNDVQVPMTLVHAKDIKYDGSNPTLLVGYGAYGINLETGYDMEALSLLDRKWILAYAHVRGGGELGLGWHAQGRGLNKKNSFMDFISCAEYLVAKKFTSPACLAAKGTSAGGLIMGYIANQRPDLFRALVLNVPFLDIATTMQDPSQPLTIHEYDEWGNPSVDSTTREYIESYSPCSNIRDRGNYPAMLVTTALNDPRVNYWEPLTWVHRLRQLRELPVEMWCKVSDDGGHFSGLGRLDQLQAAADEIVFLYHALQLDHVK